MDKSQQPSKQITPEDLQRLQRTGPLLVPDPSEPPYYHRRRNLLWLTALAWMGVLLAWGLVSLCLE